MQQAEQFRKQFSYLGMPLLNEMISEGKFQEIASNTEILREGQYVKVIPLVLKGSIKVFSRFEDKELLLYYIQPGESCIMSFSASLKNEPSKVVAITEEETSTLLLPAEKVNHWIKQFPNINSLFFFQYNMRYSELLDTINHLLFNKLDKRLTDYLYQKSTILHTKILALTHKQIANELGTAREVISRLIKKLEKENILIQHPNGIEII